MHIPRCHSDKEPACSAGDMRHMFDPWGGKIPWRRAWQPTPVFLPGESHGQRSLEGYGPWGCKESDITERLNTLASMQCTKLRLDFIYIYIYPWGPPPRLRWRGCQHPTRLSHTPTHSVALSLPPEDATVLTFLITVFPVLELDAKCSRVGLLLTLCLRSIRMAPLSRAV